MQEGRHFTDPSDTFAVKVWSGARYEDSSPAQLEWNARTIRSEYEAAADHPDYRHFIEGKFHIYG